MNRPVRVEYITPGVWEDDVDETPSVPLARPSTYVAPAPPARQPVAIDVPAWLGQSQDLQVGSALAALEGARETTSAMDRAQALRVRLLPFAVTWFLIAAGVGIILAMVAKQWPYGVIAAALTFAGLTAYSYYRLNRTDYEYSREGTEQLKVLTVAELAREKMEHDQELKRMALGAYLATLDRHNGSAR